MTINILALILMIGALTVLSARITKPLKKLTAVTAELVKGNYDVEIHADSQDEVRTSQTACLCSWSEACVPTCSI